MDLNQLLQMLMAQQQQGMNPMQAAMSQQGQPQQPQVSPGRQLGQGILSGVLGSMFTNHNKIDQSEDAPWMSGMATGGIDQYLQQYLQQYLGNK